MFGCVPGVDFFKGLRTLQRHFHLHDRSRLSLPALSEDVGALVGRGAEDDLVNEKIKLSGLPESVRQEGNHAVIYMRVNTRKKTGKKENKLLNKK